MKIDKNTPGFLGATKDRITATIAELSSPVPSRPMKTTSDTDRLGVCGAHVPSSYAENEALARRNCRALGLRR